jgi:hypothetical protein
MKGKEPEMIATGYYTRHEKRLVRKFNKTLDRYQPRLSAQFGNECANQIRADALAFFRELIPRIPYYETPLYRPIILTNAELIAIVSAMKQHGNTVEDVFRIQAALFREDTQKIPRIAGRIYASRVAGFFLKWMARRGTAEGWEAQVVRGTAADDFDVSVVTTRCGLVEYLKSEGMADYLAYCNFADFIMFPAMGIGLKQPGTIDKGRCVYCMTFGGHSEIPASLDVIYTPSRSER